VLGHDPAGDSQKLPTVENSIPSATNYSFRGGGQGGPETGPIATLSSDRFVVGWIRNSNCLYRKPLLKTS
jgi:hypothetical protein